MSLSEFCDERVETRENPATRSINHDSESHTLTYERPHTSPLVIHLPQLQQRQTQHQHTQIMAKTRHHDQTIITVQDHYLSDTVRLKNQEIRVKQSNTLV